MLKKDLSGPPVPLGEKCSEGPAVSRKNLRIAWTCGGAFHMADIVYDAGMPKLANQKKILDKKDLPFKCDIETQNFRPPEEKELTFSGYGYQGTEVLGLDLETGKVINYSNAPGQYDEPEGIFPDGKYTLVECDKHILKGSQYDDLYKLALDGSGSTERLTHFNDYPGYKASNPVVSDDGRYIAFQFARVGDPAGVGRACSSWTSSATRRRKLRTESHGRCARSRYADFPHELNVRRHEVSILQEERISMSSRILDS